MTIHHEENEDGDGQERKFFQYPNFVLFVVFAVKNHFFANLRALLSMALLAISFQVLCAEASPLFKGVKITKGAMYRANPGRTGVFNATGVVQKPTVAWTTDLGSPITSSPVVFEGKVFVGGSDGFYALDIKTGKVIWKKGVMGGVESSACIANNILCFTDTKGSLIALNVADGSELWHYQTKTKLATPEKTKSSPAIAYGVVYCGLAKELVALDMMTGKPLWSLVGDKGHYPISFSSVALTPRMMLVLGGSNWDYMFGYDLATSEAVLKSGGPFTNGSGVYHRNTPAVDANGDIFINEVRRLKRFAKEQNDKERWDLKYPMWHTFLLDKDVDDNELIEQSCATPWKDRVFAGRFDGKFVALSMKDGKILWQKKYPAEVLSAPSVADKSGTVYFGCYDANLYALDATTGEEKWKFKTGGKIISSPWVSDGAVYCSSTDGKVYALK